MITTFAGIDYGSKTAGTTVIAWTEENKGLQLRRCPRGRDADQFILDWVSVAGPDHLFIDAPLSLPGVYLGRPGCEDYFYRRADREVSAMSPMFLGGLTARAMRLSASLRKDDREVFEVYPSQLARLLSLPAEKYKKSTEHIPDLQDQLRAHLPFPVVEKEVLSWHHVDALLAWLSGWRWFQEEHESYGDPQEGLIIV